MYSTCPKCHYERKPDDHGDADTCPACGLVFSKWMKQNFAADRAEGGNTPANEIRHVSGYFRTITNLLLHVDDKINPVYFWGRVVVYIGVLAWGWKFLRMDFVNNPFEMGNSWMHPIDLVFHEAGHVFFRPFGWFMTILGGTLGQLLMPVVVMIAFMWKQRNTFGASIGLWWLGQSFMDCAPYIDDALDQKLVLLGGRTGADAPGNHDWNNILGDLNMLEKHREFADFADNTGTVLMVTALLWGAAVLYRQYRNLESF